MIRFVLITLSLMGLALGIVALLSPIPVGILLIAISLSMLICVSENARKMLKKIRTESHSVNQRFHAMEAMLEKRFKKLSHAFIRTRPSIAERSQDSRKQAAVRQHEG